MVEKNNSSSYTTVSIKQQTKQMIEEAVKAYIKLTGRAKPTYDEVIQFMCSMLVTSVNGDGDGSDNQKRF